MPHSYSFHAEWKIVVTSFRGIVAGEEVVECYRELYEDPAYVLGMDELVDLRRVKEFNVWLNSLRQVRALVEERYGGTSTTFRTAFVAPMDVSYGIGRMYQVIADESPERVNVSRTLEEAVHWLRPDAAPDLAALLAPAS